MWFGMRKKNGGIVPFCLIPKSKSVDKFFQIYQNVATEQNESETTKKLFAFGI